MKIKKLRYTGIKNRSNEINFEGICTAIVGNNRIGKTTVRDAILLGMTGQHPDLPKTNPGIMRLAGGPMMEVEVLMDDGERVKRTWMRTPKGTITAQVDGELSGVADVCPFMPSEFLVMSPKARTNYLAGLGDAAAIRERLEALGIEYDDDVSPAVAMEVAEAKVVEERKEAKREVDRLKKSLQEHFAGAPASLTSEKRALSPQDALAKLVAAKADQKNTEDRLKAIEDQIGQMRFTKDQAEKIMVGAVEPNPKRLAELTAKDAAVRATMPTRRALEDEAEEWRTFLADNGKDADAAKERLVGFDSDNEVAAPTEVQIAETKAAIQGAIRYANQYREQAAGTAEMADDQEAKTKDFLAREKCPTCGTSGAAWKERYASERQLEVSALRARAQSLIEKAVKYEHEAHQLTERLAEDQRLFATCQQNQKDREFLRRFKEAEQKAKNAEVKLAELPARMSGDEYEELDLLTAAEGRAAKLNGLGVIPTSAQIEAEEAVRADVLDALRKSKLAVGVAEDILESAMTAERQIDMMRNWEVKKADLERRKNEAQELVAESEARVVAITEAKREVMALIWKPIEDVTDAIVRLTFGDETLSVRSRDSDFGLDDKDGFRSFDVLSGSEQTVLTFGLGVALAARRNVKIAMIDELSRLDATSRAWFLEGAITGFGGVVDQIILMDHRQEFPAGVRVVKIVS